MTQQQIYLDNAATTPLSPEVLNEMIPYFTDKYGNPGSSHQKGFDAKTALDQARLTIAKILNCQTNEITFTGSATEANNLAILGSARANQAKGRHLITTKIEHPSVLESFKQLEKEGFIVTYLDVDKDGVVNPDDLTKAITNETILVSIMYANNEIGTIEPIQKLAKICQNHDIPFHTDACQAANYLRLDTENLGISMMTINGSKIYGPKGIGVLFHSLNIRLEPIIFGGGHEKGLRSGTENIPLIIGMAKALQMAQEKRIKESKRLTSLRDKLIKTILTKLPNAQLNGPSPIRSKNAPRLPNNISISIPGAEGRELILQLDEAGIYASTGSACSGKKNGPSHILKAIKCTDEQASGSLRLTLGRHTTAQDIDYVAQTLTKIISEHS